MIRSRLYIALRLLLGVVLVSLITVVMWIGLLIFFEDPAGETVTLPAVPVHPAPSGALIGTVPTIPATATDTNPDENPTPAADKPVPPGPAPDPAAAAGKEADDFEAIRGKLVESESPAPALFLRVATAASHRGMETEAGKVLRDGLDRHAGNEELLIALADHLFATGRAAEAWELVARSGREGDSRFATRLLKFSLDAGRADETLVILASAGDALPEWSGEEWVAIVRLHEMTGQLDRAIEIADRRVGDRTELFRLRARRAEKEGKLDEAIFNLEQFLARLEDPPAAEWRRLSALYESADRTDEAARALRQADRASTPAGPGAL